MTFAPNTHFVAVRLSALGDVVLTSGVLTHWHRTRGWTFSVVTRKGIAPVLENNPAVTEILPVPDDALQPAPWLHFIRDLKTSHGRFPLVDLHGSLRTRILRALWPAKTAAYPKKSLERRLFLKTRLDLFGAELRRTSVPQRYALALESSPPPRQDLVPHMYLRNEEQQHIADTLALPAGPLIGLHPYSTHPAKEWDRASWLALVDRLKARNLPWIVIGRDPAPLVPDSPRDLTNRTSLRETAAVLAACTCLVTGDSGPMHMASAVNTPVVAIFGPTSREWGFYPCGPDDMVLKESFSCAPCSLHGRKGCTRDYACMRAVTPDQVFSAVADIASCRS
jgi:ADP-heptose:LPS heptosyltransferase